jgi:TonB family protein
MAVAGGYVLLEVDVTADGGVRALEPLRGSEPYTELVSGAVSGWRFSPATRITGTATERLASRVLVAAVFRPPAIFLQESAVEEQVRSGATTGDRAPWVRTSVTPPYPPNVAGDGVVLLEVDVGIAGEARGVRVVESAGGFDSAALQAVSRWTFEPARSGDQAVPSFVYVICGFRQPVVRDVPTQDAISPARNSAAASPDTSRRHRQLRD